MKEVLMVLIVVLVAAVSIATIAGARELERKIIVPDDMFSKADHVGTVGAISSVFGVCQATGDTFYYGGTVMGPGGVPYAGEPIGSGWTNRNMWTWSADGFNGIPHSGLNMDGWVGVDNTTQSEDYFHVVDNVTLGASCVIAGTRSLFCGVSNQQSRDLCYADQNGTGYGNNWRQTVVTKSYTYNAGNQITLGYSYKNQSEAGYDFTDVILQTYDTAGGKWVDLSTLASYTDFLNGSASIDVDSYLAGKTPPVQFRIKFAFESDGGYSDEDGYIDIKTTCGAFLLDGYSLSGDVSDTEDFENVAIGGLPAGWEKLAGGRSVGNFVRVEHLNDQAIGLNQDPCVAAVPGLCEMADSVIVMYDPSAPPNYPHPCYQDNYAVSPVIDFSNHPGLAGKLFQFERFGNLPLSSGSGDYVFIYWRIRYTPKCSPGTWTEWVNNNYVLYTPEGTSCNTLSFDVSSYMPWNAQQAQLALGVLNDCCGWVDWGMECSYVNNITPYYDNVTFATYGSEEAPYISMRVFDYWQDQFAEDGTLNPTSTADSRTPNYLSNLYPPIYGDTLTCRGDADSMEVYFVFRLAKVGPRQPMTHPFFTTWFPYTARGGWFEARMDTSEITNAWGTATAPYPGRWMCAFHEQDLITLANGLAENTEVLPNNLFVPGTRIEYFVKSRYLGSALWFMLPDTTGGKYEEFEILPMMRDDGAGGLEWPCLIVADHFGGMGNWSERNSDRIARHLRANNFDFDMFNKLGPVSDLRNGIGRTAANPGQTGGPGTLKYNWGPGATLAQFLAYTHCILNAGPQLNNSMNQSDVDMVNSWLNLYSSSGRFKFFWLSGNQVARWLNSYGKAFLNNTLGATYVHRNYAEQNSDRTYCLPANGIAAGRIVCGEPESYVIRANGCPRAVLGPSVLGVSTTQGPSGVAEIEYDSQPTKRYAAVSNLVNVVGGANYKTFTEGYDFCLMRTNGSQGPLACGTDDFLTAWLGSILGWGNYNAGTACNASGPISVDDGGTSPPLPVTSLRQAFPNPMNPVARIRYTVGTSGMVWLRIYDVSGRVIRTLVAETREARREPYEVSWDGTDDRGERVSSGVFFYQLETSGYRSAKKIVIVQ
jgi:hypothetical protein